MKTHFRRVNESGRRKIDRIIAIASREKGRLERQSLDAWLRSYVPKGVPRG